jgi:1,4-dihydroxy-2-naphthoyl-CoA hydrolase
MSLPFRFPYTIALHDTDAAGVVFSPQIFRICHQAYEALMANIGFSIGSILEHRRFGLPVAHLEGDYFKPLTVGDKIEITVTVETIGDSSYAIAYEWTMDGEVQARAKTVHVCVNTQNLKKTPLPRELKSALAHYSVSSPSNSPLAAS